MNFNWLNNPHNLWGKWVQARPIQQYSLLGLLFGLLLLPETYALLETMEQGSETAAQRQSTETEVVHQRQILTTLQAKVSTAALSPELTKQIAPINQKIREFSSHGELQQEWQMAAQPKLKLQTEFSFADFTDFFTALLHNFPDLSLISLQMEKAEQGVQSNLLLQLQPNKETQ